MTPTSFTDEEIVRKGLELYEREIRQRVEPEHNGRFLVLDIRSGDYEIAEESVTAYDRAAAKHPDGALYLVRVGSPTAVRLGGQSQPRAA